MTVTVAPKKSNTGSGLQLSTISSKKRNRASRARTELDKAFTERNLRIQAMQNDELDYIDLYGYPIDAADLVRLSKDEVEKAKIGIFSVNNKTIKLATPNPGHPGQQEVIDKLAETGNKTKIYLCSDESFKKILKSYDYTVSYKETGDDMAISPERLAQLAEDGVDISSLQKDAYSISTTELLERILVSSVEKDASDIHIEPEKTNCVIRFRLDGVLHTVATVDTMTQNKLESRIKILTHLKLNVDSVPQDGRFSFIYKENEIDLRVSMLPSNYGYSIVMRLLGTGSVALQLEALGFIGEAKRRVEEGIVKPQGLILASGPTGSGKTTTLYTFLSYVNDGKKKIITLEDPIEYKLAGISQTQIDKAGGYTFASGLRSILRQDPDVVMVGEIRDELTADVAVEASLTGHKVLSTIHTNDAVGSIPRFLEMGVKGYALADSLTLVIGQRLVRRVCPKCKVPVNIDDAEKNLVMDILGNLPDNHGIKLPNELTFYSGAGCDHCNNTGYKGRIGVYEIFTITDGVRDLLNTENPSFAELRRVAMKEGMVTMLQDGIVKAILGKTDMKEVARVLQK